MIFDDSPKIKTNVKCTVKELYHLFKWFEKGNDTPHKINEIKGEGNCLALCLVDINTPEMDDITFVREFGKADSLIPILMLPPELGVRNARWERGWCFGLIDL